MLTLAKALTQSGKYTAVMVEVATGQGIQANLRHWAEHSESLTLLNFTEIEVATLYQQHTNDTGQIFTPEAVNLAFELTQGQPWLVNALAKEVVEELVEDASIAITPEHINQAKEILIRRQDTHLDSLAERLRENRVKAIIQPMLAGQEMGNIPNDNRRNQLTRELAQIDT
jgi:hypothetical protein